MERIKLGNTGLKASKLGFGAMHLPKVSVEESDRLLNRALDMGINYIDTARAYQDSEEKVGRVVSKRRDECIITTRSHTWKMGIESYKKDFETSLKTLKVDRIDFYGLHSVNKKEELDMVMGKHLEFLKKAKEKGDIGHLLISGHNHITMTEAVKTGEFEMAFFPFNVIEKEPLDMLIEEANRRNVITVVMKPLGGGVIPHIPLALSFFLSYNVDLIVPGVASLKELEENFRVIEENKKLTKSELEKLEKSVEVLGKDFCRRCSYCQPCQSNIMIPFIHGIHQRCYGKPMDENIEYMLNTMGKRLLPSLKTCTECGQCEEQCPYNLPTRQRIKDIISMVTA
ncbi:MAG: hypothetical protein A2042_07880 [Candidatus Schekmanbacteria bacterium GWA2_38_11]|uniref:4Fe-4S ferredoxin-type domain-containing protein n=1 Tax=Candidatus Schekmanbacteria bacterium GWA2_38_11 TaxID=1817876 RepID=A0A1F7RCH6_9BACT|nr:MAG: hypothetical protein A2042_07880 [Candidatus Schekmanbacteria bacterium GWA2_38_11]